MECVGVIVVCVGVCFFVEIDELVCIVCFGVLYEICKKCYLFVDKCRVMNDIMFMLNVYYKDISYYNMVFIMVEFL